MLDHQKICELIPHSTSMCLLDHVTKIDDNKIICTSNSHKLSNNPLRNTNELPMISLLEYGAQAMAVHGRLKSDQQQSRDLEEGYLAALRDIKITQGDLSLVKDELQIHAEKIFSDAGNMIYSMEIHAGSKVLASGRATVVAKFK